MVTVTIPYSQNEKRGYRNDNLFLSVSIGYKKDENANLPRGVEPPNLKLYFENTLMKINYDLDGIGFQHLFCEFFALHLSVLY